MTPTPTTVSDLPTIPTSQATPRLRADVTLYAAADGHVLRVGETHHQVQLHDRDLDALLDALVDGGEPATPLARAALASLVAAGLADLSPAHLTVNGDGALATALHATLVRMGAAVGQGGAPVTALDDDALPADLSPTAPVCWVSGHHVVLSPPAVPALQVAARHRAATRHHGADSRSALRPGGRRVHSAAPVLAPAGLELAAAQVAAELLRPERPSHEAVVIDLTALSVSRHPVLPVPPAPR